jgi:AraC-like DNA-binding protein
MVQSPRADRLAMADIFRCVTSKTLLNDFGEEASDLVPSISGSKIRGASRVLVGIGLIVRGRIKCVLLKEARLHNLIDPASYLQGPLLLLPRLCNERVSEVALDIGFKSITNFNRTFKQLAGQSPSDYDWRFREHLNQTGIAVHVSYFYSRRGKPPTLSKVTGITRFALSHAELLHPRPHDLAQEEIEVARPEDEWR